MCCLLVVIRRVLTSGALALASNFWNSHPSQFHHHEEEIFWHDEKNRAWSSIKTGRDILATGLTIIMVELGIPAGSMSWRTMRHSHRPATTWTLPLSAIACSKHLCWWLAIPRRMNAIAHVHYYASRASVVPSPPQVQYGDLCLLSMKALGQALILTLWPPSKVILP